MSLASRPDSAVVIDLENLLHPLRCLGRTAVEEGLHGVVDEIAAIRDVGWLTGVGDYWLCRLALLAAHDLGVRLHPGPIGADRADGEIVRRLLHDIPASARNVVLVSGDGGYTETVSTLQRRGLRVTVAARRCSLSARLELVANHVIKLTCIDELLQPEVAS